MEISIEKIQKLEPVELYEYYKNDFLDFYASLNDLTISKEKYKRIVLEELEDIQQYFESNQDTDINDYLIRRINYRLSQEKEDNATTFAAFINEIKRQTVLPQEEVYELINKSQNGDKEATEKLVEHNLKLVLNIAKRYLGRGMSLEDLMQEGSIGLYSAINKFDLSTGNQFSTYAVWWIRQSITRAIAEKARTIRLPIHVIGSINKLSIVEKELEKKLGRTPTTNELAEKLKISLDKVIKLISLKDDVISLNKKISKENGDDTELGYFIESHEDVESDIISDNLKRDIYKTFENANLTEKEKVVLTYRFGLFNTKKMTLEDLGNMIGLTRERVRQIEITALKKMEKALYKNNLTSYIGIEKKEEKLVEDYFDIEKVLPQEAKDYFNECHLTSLEMKVMALHLGLVGGVVKTNKEIATMINIPASRVVEVHKNCLNKLNPTPKRGDFIDYLKRNYLFDKQNLFKDSTNSNNKEKDKSLCTILNCSAILLKRAAQKLTDSEYKIFNKRNTDNYSLLMTKEEMYIFDTRIMKKLKRNIQEVIDSDTKKKAFLGLRKEIDHELHDTVKKIYNSRLFQELIKQISLKETIAVLLLYGYLDDSYYPADYVSTKLNMPIEKVFEACMKTNDIFNKYKNAFYRTDKQEIKELIMKKN